MHEASATEIRANLYKTLDECISYNDLVKITTKKGNAIVMSEDYYNDLIESLYLAGIPGVYESIREGLKEKNDDMTPWKKVK
jgi:antitoxin YefM